MNLSETEIKILKEEVKREVLRELEDSKQTRKTPLGMMKAKEKWMYGPDKRFRYSGSELEKLFGNKQHRVWDSVRALTKVIFGIDNQSQLPNVDQQLLEHVCNVLFETVSELRNEVVIKSE